MNLNPCVCSLGLYCVETVYFPCHYTWCGLVDGMGVTLHRRAFLKAPSRWQRLRFPGFRMPLVRANPSVESVEARAMTTRSNGQILRGGGVPQGRGPGGRADAPAAGRRRGSRAQGQGEHRLGYADRDGRRNTLVQRQPHLGRESLGSWWWRVGCVTSVLGTGLHQQDGLGERLHGFHQWQIGFREKRDLGLEQGHHRHGRG